MTGFPKFDFLLVICSHAHFISNQITNVRSKEL